MIHAQHSWFYTNFYRLYSNWIIKRNFSHINIDIPEVDNAKPLLVIGNHHSWWDGFWVMHLNNSFWKKRFFVMMLLEQLQKHSSFSRAGAFSIEQGKRSVLETMEYAKQILQSPDNMLLMYPQGRIESQHQSYIHFQKGAVRLIERVDNVNVLMLITLTDYLSEKKNGLWVYGKLLHQKTDIESRFNDFYLQAKKIQQQCIG